MPRYRIAAVDRAVAILETFTDGRALTQAEISRAAGLSEATTLRYLSTLNRNGLVERDAHSDATRSACGCFSWVSGRSAPTFATPRCRSCVSSRSGFTRLSTWVFETPTTWC